jgi:glycosyltransferase involved in cell wall biosynthesis
MTALCAQPRNGYQFELLSSRDLEEEYRSELYPVHAHLAPLRHRSEFSSSPQWMASRLMHYIRREMEFLAWLKTRPDVSAVHLQEWTPWLAAPLLRRIKAMDKKVFATVHNVYPHKYPRLVPKFVIDSWNRSACRLCDGIFVHTDQLAARMSHFLGEPHPRVYVLPHGVWTVKDASFGSSIEQRLATRKLLFFGSIRRNKGLDILLDAMRGLEGFSLTIAGEAIEPAYFREAIIPRIDRLVAAGAKIDLREGFTPEEKIGELFHSHSAVVLPYTSAFAAQSGVVFMALAYELPVIASEAGGLRDLFGQHKIGITFREPAAAQIVAAVNQLFGEVDPKVLAAEIQSAKRTFSWDAAAAVAIAAYGSPRERSLPQDDCALETNLAH